MRAIKAVFDAEKLVTGDPRIPSGGSVKSVQLIRPSMYAKNGLVEIIYYHDEIPDSPYTVPLSPDEHFKVVTKSEPKLKRGKSKVKLASSDTETTEATYIT